VRPVELAVVVAEPAERFDDPSIGVELTEERAVGGRVGLVAAVDDVDEAVGPDAHAEGSAHARPVPLVDKLPRAVEDLHARVAAVADVDAPARVRRDAVRQVELAAPGSGPAPLEQEPPVGRELRHAGVAVAVAHVEGAVGQHGHVGRHVEVRAVFAGHAALAEGPQELPLVAELEDLMKRNVRDPDVIAAVHGQPVRHDERAPSPGGERPPGPPVEEHDGGVPHGVCGEGLRPRAPRAVEDEDVVARVHADARDAAEDEPLGQHGPAVYDPVMSSRTHLVGAARGRSVSRVVVGARG